MGFYEVLWHGKGIGDGAGLDEALLAYSMVKPDNGEWDEACLVEGADPHINRYESFDAYLDNANRLERIAVTSLMISQALENN